MRVMVREYITGRGAGKGMNITKPVPLRVMEVVEKGRETDKAVYVKLKGFAEPSSFCLHCGRRITHPVSLMYGVGPICGGHFHIAQGMTEDEVKEKMEEIKAAMGAVTWEGFLPKKAIEWMKHEVEFFYNGNRYRDFTDSQERINEIIQKAEAVRIDPNTKVAC